jgi:hypothetical protein
MRRVRSTPWRSLEDDGFALLRGAFTPAEASALADSLTAALAHPGTAGPAIRGEGGAVYAARNVLELWPEARVVWRRPPLLGALADVLGPDFGLVRALYFDKPPGPSWALPWHKDLTVAVRDNRLPGAHFARPTRKAGVPHAEAPLAVLEAMLTARLHLDAVTPANGPLQVVPGSHRAGKALLLGGAEPVAVLCEAGDVLLMRPLLAHRSGKSQPDTARHRRVLHLEFAASADLPDGYAWHDFFPGSTG